MKYRNKNREPSKMYPDFQHNGEETADPGDNRCLSERPLALLGALDARISSRLAICSNVNSKFGNLRPLMKLLEISCHGIPWLFGNVIALYMTNDTATRHILLNLFMALILDLIIVGLIKMIVRRPRPAHNKMDMFATVSVDLFSFPSGHATRAAMVACFLLATMLVTGDMRLLVVLWAMSVAASRVLLGRHHIGDVICGLAVGVLEYRLVRYLWLPRSVCQQLLARVLL